MFDLGFVSAIFNDENFEEVIDFASVNGFRCVELMCWPKGKAERRYAGVTHIDVDNLDETMAGYIKDYLAERNVYISGLGYYPNPLDPDPEKRDFYFSHLKKVIDAATLLKVPVVNTFVGRDQHKTLDENLEAFVDHWPKLIEYAESLDVKIGIENCPMLFTHDEWPGGKNLASTPILWEKLFDTIPSAHFGLNYDPSHLVWQQIDYLAPLQAFRHRLFHIHIKDAKINRQQLERVGVLAAPLDYHSPKLPGLGDIDWERFFNGLKETGYRGAVVIEFEDKDFERSTEDIVRGLLQAKTFVERYI